MALLWAAGVAGARPPGFLAALLVALSVPIFVFGMWRAALRRAHELRLFHDGGRLRPFLGRPTLRTIVWLVASPALALAVVIGAAGANRPTTIAYLVPPVLCLVFLLADRVLRAEVAAPHRRAMALRAAVFITPVLLVATDFAALALGGEMPAYPTLAEAVRANIPAEPARSAVVDELLRLAGHVNAMQAFALGRVEHWGGALRPVAWIGLAALNLAFYAGLARALAMFILPRAEWRRALLPASDAPVPRRLSVVEIAVTSALATILLVFIVIPAVATAEDWLRSNAPPTAYVRTVVEMIDGKPVRPGTIDIVHKLQADTAKGLGIDRAALERAANAGFDAMAGNVDLYLDAYYSLPAEYLRIASLVWGGEALERKLAEDLQERLMEGAPFAAYKGRLEAALRSAERVRTIYESAVGQVLETAALDLPAEAHIEVAAATTRSALALPTPEGVLTTTGGRAGAAAAVAGGIVTALVVKKVVSKGTLKLASKAVVKVALSKTAGALGGAGAGAAAGAAIGSVVPGVGTAVGAVVGGVAGAVAVGVGVDYLLLKLEETWSREDFRQQILASIETQRSAFLAELRR